MLLAFWNSRHCLITTIFSSNLSLLRQIFFSPVLAEDSLSKVVYMWRCSTAVRMDGGWFFKREINNSEGSAENVTRTSFRTLPRHVNEKKPREHILTSTIKNIVHILSGSPLCRVWPRGSSLLIFHDYKLVLGTTVVIIADTRTRHYTCCTRMWPLRVERHMLRHVLYLQQRKKNAFHSYGTYSSLVCKNNNTTYECWINSIHEHLQHLKRRFCKVIYYSNYFSISHLHDSNSLKKWEKSLIALSFILKLTKISFILSSTNK